MQLKKKLMAGFRKVLDGLPFFQQPASQNNLRSRHPERFNEDGTPRELPFYDSTKGPNERH
jgi:hypothetical protein